MEWIKCEDELPPCDGWYQCTNHPDNPFDLGVARYDGYGFDCFGIYRNPEYWRFMVVKSKKYGKVKELKPHQD